jgi:hypothetical protein
LLLTSNSRARSLIRILLIHSLCFGSRPSALGPRYLAAVDTYCPRAERPKPRAEFLRTSNARSGSSSGIANR